MEWCNFIEVSLKKITTIMAPIIKFKKKTKGLMWIEEC
jgi:hypothetical protein